MATSAYRRGGEDGDDGEIDGILEQALEATGAKRHRRPRVDHVLDDLAAGKIGP